MANIDFPDLNQYITKIASISTTIYDDKHNVNVLNKNLVDTHVTAEDLNFIKEALTGLADNVNAINSYLINASSETGDSTGGSVTEQTITNDLNQFLSNQYLRKNQLIVDGNVANDSVINFDEHYIRNRYIFVDGFKLSPNSPYNLISYNQINLMVNSLCTNFDTVMRNMRYELTAACSTMIEDMTQNNISGVDVQDGDDGLGVWLWSRQEGKDENNNTIYTHFRVRNHRTSAFAYDSKLYDITWPLSDIWVATKSYVDWKANYISDYIITPVRGDVNNLYLHIVNSGNQDRAYVKTMERNEWGYGVRLIGQGYKIFNRNAVLDPQFRQYKYYRVYSGNDSNANLSSITTFYDPDYVNNDIGNNYPFSSTVTPDNLSSTDPNPSKSNKKFKIIKNIHGSYDYTLHSQGPMAGADTNKTVWQGYTRGWMECGGQQRVFLKKEGNFLVCTPSTITFPIPFETGQGLEIQVTVKRDIADPFPYIVPISVVKEDTYFFDIAGGAQGIPNANDVQYRELMTTGNNWITIDGVERNVVYVPATTIDGVDYPERFYYATSNTETANYTNWQIILDGNGNKHYFTKILEPPPTGFVYIKWSARGVYSINNLVQYYYMLSGYNKIHDLYWIKQSTVNGHYDITDYDPLTSYITEQDFKKFTLLSYCKHIYEGVFKTSLETALGETGVSDRTQSLRDYIYNYYSTLFKYKLVDGIGIYFASDNITLFDNDSTLLNCLGSITINDALTSIVMSDEIIDYLTGIIINKAGWSSEHIRTYVETSYSTINESYSYILNKVLLPANSLHTPNYNATAEELNYQPQLYKQGYPFSNVYDDDVNRLRSTITGGLTFITYNNGN